LLLYCTLLWCHCHQTTILAYVAVCIYCRLFVTCNYHWCHCSGTHWHQFHFALYDSVTAREPWLQCTVVALPVGCHVALPLLSMPLQFNALQLLSLCPAIMPSLPDNHSGLFCCCGCCKLLVACPFHYHWCHCCTFPLTTISFCPAWLNCCPTTMTANMLLQLLPVGCHVSLSILLVPLQMPYCHFHCALPWCHCPQTKHVSCTLLLCMPPHL